MNSQSPRLNYCDKHVFLPLLKRIHTCQHMREQTSTLYRVQPAVPARNEFALSSCIIHLNPPPGTIRGAHAVRPRVYNNHNNILGWSVLN